VKLPGAIPPQIGRDEYVHILLLIYTVLYPNQNLAHAKHVAEVNTMMSMTTQRYLSSFVVM
jgi:hypothetical protein